MGLGDHSLIWIQPDGFFFFFFFFLGATFDIDNVSFYDDEKLALDESSENDWKRRGLYFGPTFIDLDEELQQSFTDFLNERAIGSELAAM